MLIFEVSRNSTVLCLCASAYRARLAVLDLMNEDRMVKYNWDHVSHGDHWTDGDDHYSIKPREVLQ